MDRENLPSKKKVKRLDPSRHSLKEPNKNRRDRYSLSQKVEIIEIVRNKMSYEQIINKFNMKSRSNVCTIYANRNKYLSAFNSSVSSTRLSLKMSDFKAVEESLLDYIQKCSAKTTSK